MARPRTPAAVLELRGSYKRNPKRRREEPDVSGPLGDAPSYFSGEELVAWNDITSGAPREVLTSADRITVELSARLLAESRLNWTNFSAAKLARLEAILGKFGMSPADRSKVTGGGKKKDSNPFAQLLG
ncbi:MULTISPECIES: hypothetical protein [unclassified Caballeronia]|uniref:hypothetical protein n=1 Tax=unclassified Caballeronia TaxID=2646786 RepID=UPI0028594BBC|nr:MULTISPECIES: hypothetical protein [unclassified Caballeronia]MDR5777294.1 hypothetical protein [Caballeronia sp. LZ002]MDR5802572.1 hypothetical protein [Caballeronia sp. LZ001]MDR5852732.1 hypothetical protein [Caballeronia sp. LZ003]